MSRAMVSRYLESFERWLGVRVLHRTTRRVSLTDAGEEALQRCRQMLELSRDVQSVAGARRDAPGGKLRITTSTSFATAYLADVVTEFLTRYPQTQVELIALERAVNLVEERIDLAVRIGNVLDDSLVARKLGVCRSVVCASPAYIKASGYPQHSGRSSKPPLHHPRLRWPHRVSPPTKRPDPPDSRERTTAEQRGSRHAPRCPRRRRDCDVAYLPCQRGPGVRGTPSSTTRLRARAPWHPRGVLVSSASATTAEDDGRLSGRSHERRSGAMGSGQSPRQRRRQPQAPSAEAAPVE